MSGYFAPDPAWWKVTRTRLPKPWLKEDALIDLRFWQDQVLLGAEEMPGGRELAEQWGWGHKKVRLLLQKEEQWSDPAKLSAWREYRGHTEGTPGAQQGHTEGTPAEGETPDIDDKGHTEGTQGAQSGHGKGHTREPLSSPVTDTDTDHEEQRAREPTDPSPPESIEEQREMLLALQERDCPDLGAPSPRDGAVLTSALLRGVTVEALLVLWAWSGVSEDPLVAGCRRGSWRRWGPLLKGETGEARLTAAAAWHAAGRPTGSTGPPASRKRFSVNDLGAEPQPTPSAGVAK